MAAQEAMAHMWFSSEGDEEEDDSFGDYDGRDKAMADKLRHAKFKA